MDPLAAHQKKAEFPLYVLIRIQMFGLVAHLGGGRL